MGFAEFDLSKQGYNLSKAFLILNLQNLKYGKYL